MPYFAAVLPYMFFSSERYLVLKSCYLSISQFSKIPTNSFLKINSNNINYPLGTAQNEALQFSNKCIGAIFPVIFTWLRGSYTAVPILISGSMYNVECNYAVYFNNGLNWKRKTRTAIERKTI